MGKGDEREGRKGLVGENRAGKSGVEKEEQQAKNMHFLPPGVNTMVTCTSEDDPRNQRTTGPVSLT